VTRRDFLTTGVLAGAWVLVSPGGLPRSRAAGLPVLQASHRGWGEVAGILARITPPVFPDRVFPVTEHGAVGDGVRDCTAAW
jgi:hypothetical protein